MPDSEVHTVMIGAQAEKDQKIELMEAIPQEKQLTVTFTQISGWVALLHGQPSTLQKLQNITKAQKDVPEAAKPQRKQASPRAQLEQFGTRQSTRFKALTINGQCRSCSSWQERAILERCLL